MYMNKDDMDIGYKILVEKMELFIKLINEIDRG